MMVQAAGWPRVEVDGKCRGRLLFSPTILWLIILAPLWRHDVRGASPTFLT